MKKYIFILWFIITTIYLCADFYLIPDSNKRILSEDELKNKSTDFIIYAKNEIIARKGRIFDDPELEVYFRNMTWYSRNHNKIELSKIEKSNFYLPAQIENSRGKKTEWPYNLPYRYFFNGKPLFYFGINNIDNEGSDKILYDVGELLLLNKESNWTLSCKSIPYEYVKQNCISSLTDIKDACNAIWDSTRINIIDIDNLEHKLQKRTISEIIIQANPESGNSNGWIYVIEENENEKLEFIFQAKGNLANVTSINDSILNFELSRTVTWDKFPAASGLTQDYVFNRKTNKALNIPLTYEKLNLHYEYKSITEIPLYKDAISAHNKNSSSIIGFLKYNIKLKIFEFYYSPENSNRENVFENLRAFLVKSNDGRHKGWVNIEDFENGFKPLYPGG